MPLDIRSARADSERMTRTMAATAQELPFTTAATFDGDTIEHAIDHGRLGRQLAATWQTMCDGEWRTLAQLAAAIGAPEASVSARLRDLRKPKFGGFTVERDRVAGGLWRYRVVTS